MKRHLPTIFAVVLGIVAAVLLCNWSVCEQDDRYCAFTGVAAK